MSIRKLKVCYLAQGIGAGGATMSLLILLEQLSQLGSIDITLIVVSRKVNLSILARFEALKIRILFVPVPTIHYHQIMVTSIYRLIWVIIFRRKSIKKLVETIKCNNFDVLHINSSVFPHVLKPLSKIDTLKIVTHIREYVTKDSDTWRNRIVRNYLIKKNSKYSHHLIFISENEYNAFLSRNKIFKSFSYSIMLNPYPINFNICEKNYRAKPLLTINIGMLANAHPLKGNILFLETLKNIVNKKDTKFPPFHFFMLGLNSNKIGGLKSIVKWLIIGDYYRQIAQFIEQNPEIKEYITILPSSPQPLDFVRDMDIIVRPALTQDPWGRDIIEAMGCGKPVIATGTSNVLIKDGITGFLVECCSASDISTKVVALINDRDLRNRMGVAGCEFVRTACDPIQYSQRVVDLYNKISE